MTKQIIKYSVLLILGGLLYVVIELLFRGHSHWTMFLLGGICFVLCGLLNEITCKGNSTSNMPLTKQMLYGAVIITVLEFITGCVVNLYLGWNVWDYSKLPLNIYGQVSLLFSIAWYFVSGIAIITDDYLRYWFFHEEKPHYTLF